MILKYSKPLYINQELFNEYICNVLIPYITTLREYPMYFNEPAVLLLYSCSAQFNDEILKTLGKNNVKTVTFPAHTTNIF